MPAATEMDLHVVARLFARYGPMLEEFYLEWWEKKQAEAMENPPEPEPEAAPVPKPLPQPGPGGSGPLPGS